MSFPIYNQPDSPYFYPFMDPETTREFVNVFITFIVVFLTWIVLQMSTQTKNNNGPIVPSPPGSGSADAEMLSPTEKANKSAVLSEAKKNYVLDISRSRCLGKSTS